MENAPNMEIYGEAMRQKNPPDKSVEAAKTSNGPLLVFGQGPVIDRATRVIPSKDATNLGDEDINLWSKNLAKAASELYKRGQAPQIILVGGKTGGEQYRSEADLIKKYMNEEGVPENVIFTEENSQDTIANLINLINIRDQQGIDGKEKYQILGTPYHISRTQILMQLFRVPFNHVFASDEVLRFVARGGKTDSASWNTNLLSEIEMRLNTNDDRYYQQKQGTEKRDYLDRLVTDDLFTRELLQNPESWLGRVAEIQSDTRRREILSYFEKLWPGMLAQEFGIKMDSDSPEESREKLARIQKKPLSDQTMQQWAQENKTIGWPKDVERRLHALIEERKRAHQ